jgi:hypothetical protein
MSFINFKEFVMATTLLELPAHPTRFPNPALAAVAHLPDWTVEIVEIVRGAVIDPLLDGGAETGLGALSPALRRDIGR